MYNKRGRDFLGGPVVKTPPSNAGGTGSVPCQGAKIPHASWPKTKTLNKSNKFNKVFLKKKKKKKKEACPSEDFSFD